MTDTMEDSIIPLEIRHGIVWGESFTQTKWGLPVYAVINGHSTTYFDGETAYQDSERYFYDLILPLIYRKGTQ